MKITYIVLTCEKNYETKCSWIKNTWATLLEPNDSLFFLSNKSDPSKNIIGYDTPDDYDSCVFKFLNFYEKYEDHTDWFFICDDDTFVYPDRLKKLLSHCSISEPLCIGQNKDHHNRNSKFKWLSGGAGVAMNFLFFTAIKVYLKTVDSNKRHSIKKNDHGYNFGVFTDQISTLTDGINEVLFHKYIDVTLSMWSIILNIPIRDENTLFRSQNFYHEENKNINADEVISFHYCDAPLFDKLFQLRK